MGNIYTFAMQYPHITELFIRTNREFDNGIFDKSYFDMLNLVGNKTGDNTNYLKIVKDILTSNDPYTNFYLKYPQLACFYYKIAPMVDFKVIDDYSLDYLREIRKFLVSDVVKEIYFPELISLNNKINSLLNLEEQAFSNADILDIANVKVRERKKQ